MTIDFFALAANLQNVRRIVSARRGRGEIRQQAKIDNKNPHHLIAGRARKEALKDEPHHGSAKQDAEYAIASDCKVGLDVKLTEMDEVKREGELHSCIGKPGAGSCNPRSNGSHGGEEHRESDDGIDERENEDLGANACDHATEDKASDAQDLFLAGGADGCKSGNKAGE